MSRTFRHDPKTGATKRDGFQTRFASCHNNGGCPICEGNRLHRHARALPAPDTRARYTLDTEPQTLQQTYQTAPRRADSHDSDHAPDPQPVSLGHDTHVDA